MITPEQVLDAVFPPCPDCGKEYHQHWGVGCRFSNMFNGNKVSTADAEKALQAGLTPGIYCEKPEL